jgi:hypothetical protein
MNKRRITYTLLLAVGRLNIVPLLGQFVAMALRLCEAEMPMWLFRRLL